MIGRGQQSRKFRNYFREDLQSLLSSLNPLWTSMESPGELNPDGDVTIEEGAEKTFKSVGRLAFQSSISPAKFQSTKP